MDAGGGNFLLYGATGSGKTEVYLQACAAALERGLGAIVLVPEIALAPQTVGRVRARFGDRVAILHSALTDAERRDERERIASGEARIVVGARSAIFAPVAGLGLIVVDEEHDPSYKQDSDPRYDARTVAAKRAALEGAVAVYGSATPRPESWAALERLALGGRIGAGLPPVRVVDLRREAGLSALGAAPRGAARRRRAPRQGDPAAQPPRDRAGAPLPRVRHDDPLPELRRLARAARRHVAALPPLRLRHRRAVELPRLRLARSRAARRGHAEARARAAPRGARARADPARRGRGREARAAGRLAARFRDAEGAVLLGTQMVAKGHHFAGVELAAVIDADTGLAMPDFRAEERTFQLITQLAGRSGRDAPGRVIVQTFQPDSRTIAHAARHDVERFLAEELERREALGYPPYAHLVRIVVTRAGAGAGRARARGAEGRHAGRRAARPGAAPAPARQAPRAARREDGAPAADRLAGGAAARRGGAGDAARAADRGGRRRSAVALSRHHVGHEGAAPGGHDRRVGDPRRDAAVAEGARARSTPSST